MTGVLLVVAGGCSPKGKQQSLGASARKHFEAGDYKKAESEYQEVLRKHPDNADAFKRLGIIYLDQGRFEYAGGFLTRASQLATNDLEIRLKLSLAFLNVGLRSNAREAALQVLAGIPDDEDAPMVLVESCSTETELAGARDVLSKLSPASHPRPACEVASAVLSLSRQPADIAAARSALATALKLNPKFPAAYSVLGALCRSTNGVSQAEQAYRTAAELSPKHSNRRIQYALFKFEIGDHAGGKKLLEEVAHDTPDSVLAWLNLARIALGERNHEAARKYLDELLEIDRSDLQGLLLDAALKLAIGDTAGAVDGYQRLLKRFPKSGPIHFELSRAYSAQGDLANAADELRQVLSLKPNDIQATLTLAQLDLMRGDLDAGVFSLEKLVQQHPEIVPAGRLLAQGYHAQGKLKLELAQYRRLQAALPNDPEFFLREGGLKSEEKQPDEARVLFEKALKLAPKYPASLVPIELLVQLDLETHHPELALQRADQLILENTNAPEPLYLKALVCLALKTPAGTNQAESYLLNATRLKPDYSPAYLGLVRIYSSRNEKQKAIENLQEIIAKDPRDKSTWTLLGSVQAEQKDFVHARESYLKVLALDPKFVPALNNLAYIDSENLNQLDEAYKLASKARELTPADPSTGDTLGWVLYHQHKFAWAATLLQESFNLSPRDPEKAYHVGMAQYMMGAEAASVTSLKRALALGQDFPGRDKIPNYLNFLELDPKSLTEDSLSKRLATEPDDVIAMGRLAALFARRGDYEKAAAKWEAALAVNPENVTTLINLSGLYSEQLKQPKKARELAFTAYKLAPENLAAQRLYARVCFQAGEYDQAVAMYTELATRLPNDPSVLFELAEAQFSVGDLTGALRSSQNALSHKPFPQEKEAQSFSQLINTATAPPAGLAEQILKDRPDYLPALASLARQSEARGDGNEAVKILERIRSLNPHYTPAVRSLAILYSPDPKMAKAADVLAREALRAYPEDPVLKKAAGAIAFHNGVWLQATSLLAEAMTGPGLEDARSKYYEGMSYFQLRQNTKARVALERAVELGLQEPALAQALDTLKHLK